MTQARRSAIAFLARPGQATDQFAIATYDDARKLSILHEFSSDRASLTRTLQASLHDAVRLSGYAGQRDARIEELRRPTNGGARGAEVTATSYASEDSSTMARILNLTRSLVDGLASWPGYKALVYVGDGIPENPGQEYGVAAGTLSLTAEVGGLALAAAGSNVTLHAVQASGLEAGSAAEMSASSARTNVLKTLALNTGGVSTTTNDLTGAFASIEASAAGYYVLAYAPEDPPDGRSHSINLKLRSRNLDLRYRRTFTRFTPSQARARAIEAAFVVPELHPDLDLDLVAVAGPVTSRARFVDLVIYVPSGKLLYLPDPQGAAARLEVGLVALDPDKKEIFRLARSVRVAGDARLVGGATPAAGGSALALNLHSRVMLPASGGSITAVVADDASGTIGSARVQVAAFTAERPGAEGLSLYAVDEQSLWVEIESADAAHNEARTTASRWIGPALRTRFAPGERIACGFRMPGGGGTAVVPRELRLDVLQGEAVVRSRGMPAAGDMAGPPVNPAAPLSAELPLAGLADGDYLLRLQEDGQPDAVELGRVPFRIVPRAAP
jgi:VWFA-related protein